MEINLKEGNLRLILIIILMLEFLIDLKKRSKVVKHIKSKFVPNIKQNQK